MADQTFDIIIVGGSLGGVAAALRAADIGASVCLIEPTLWVGGQYTSQGVSKPDENRFVETTGSTAAYRDFRHNVRLYYRNNARLSPQGQAQSSFNPGGPDDGFALEPRIGHFVLTQQLTASPNIIVRMNTTVTQVERVGRVIQSLTATGPDGTSTRYIAKYFLDATDLGDLLPLAGANYTIGAESSNDTGEPCAPLNPHPEWIQPITLVFALDFRPGENHTITPPSEYAQLKAEQRYSIMDGYITTMFQSGTDMWSYRRFIYGSNFADPAYPNDITMINTAGDDYKAATIPTGSPASDASIIARARQASLGYLYWLQTECPRDDGSLPAGYPELRLRSDVFNTGDGTAPMPYIRESRRIRAVRRIVQQDIDSDYNPGPRAKLFRDSCGIGLYNIDIHPLTITGMPEIQKTTKPFQIPAGALVADDIDNLLAACKNLGVTHITNGAYRVHPSEWNIGESAGALAAYCVQSNSAPRDVVNTAGLLAAYQHLLLAKGVPLFWWTDITTDNMPLFTAAHLLGVNGIMSGGGGLDFQPDAVLDAVQQADIENSVGHPLAWPNPNMSRGDAAVWLVQELGL